MIDQLEELLTQTPAVERARFAQLLQPALRGPVQVVATLRPELRGRVGDLSEQQLIGLRFACDAEAAALAERALKEKLSQRDIKKSVVGWRADHWRV